MRKSELRRMIREELSHAKRGKRSRAINELSLKDKLGIKALVMGIKASNNGKIPQDLIKVVSQQVAIAKKHQDDGQALQAALDKMMPKSIDPSMYKDAGKDPKKFLEQTSGILAALKMV